MWTVMLLTATVVWGQYEPLGAVECAQYVPSGQVVQARCAGLVSNGATYARLKRSPGSDTEAEFSDRKAGLVNAALGALLDVSQNQNCSDRLLAMICTVIIPPCEQLGDTGYEWRSRLCTHECTRLFEECPDDAARFNEVEPTARALFGMSILCPSLTYDDGYYIREDQYPAASPGAIEVTVPGSNANQTFQMQCVAPYTSNTSVVQCPGDAITDTQGVCQAKCPVGRRVYNDSQWNKLDKVLEVGGWISFSLSIVMLATWSLQTRKRVFPSRFVLFFSLCLLLMSVAMVSSSLVGEDDMRCHNDYTPQTGARSAACFAQGFLWVVGSVGMTLWWLAFVVTLFLLLTRDVATKELQKKEWLFHVIVWPLAFLPAVIAAAAGKFRYNPTGMLCFISNENGPEWQLALYYVPQLLLLLVGTALMIVVLTRVMKNAVRIKKYSAAKAVLRFFVFIPLYIVVLVTFLTAAMRKLDVNTVLEEGNRPYYLCLVAGSANSSTGRDVVDEELLLRCARQEFGALHQFSFDMASRVLFGFMGLWIFCIFGLQMQNWTFWKRQIRRLLNTAWTTTTSQRSSTTHNRTTRTRQSNCSLELQTPTARTSTTPMEAGEFT